MKKSLLLLVLILNIMLILSAGCNASVNSRSIVSETPVCNLTNKSGYSPVVYSRDLSHVAYFTETNGKRYLTVNGKTVGKGYDNVMVSYGIFSPDGTRTACKSASFGDAGTTWYLVIDGEQGDGYSTIGDVIFSPDSMHVAYIADGNVYLDREQLNSAPASVSAKNGLVFSPDSKSLVYVINKAGKQCIVLDRDEGSLYDEIGTVLFSPDGKHLAYTARNGTSWFVVEDGVPGTPYDGIGTLAYSPGSNHFAYVAEKGSQDGVQIFIVRDGSEGEKYKLQQMQDFAPSLVFSPDGNHLAYSYEEKITTVQTQSIPGYVVVDAKQKATTNGRVFDLHYSPDGQDLFYIEDRSITTSKNSFVAVVNGKTGMPYYKIGDVSFSPDSQHYAYKVFGIGNNMFVIVDGNIGNTYSCIDPSGSEDPAYYGISGIIFNSNEQFSYLAKKGDTVYLITEALSG